MIADLVTPVMTQANRQSSISNRQCIAWHGLNLHVPDTWNPVKIDGDYDAGAILLADMQDPKLGIRWKKVKKAKVLDSIRAEVGQLAAEEAVKQSMSQSDVWSDSTVYIEPDPPGRDVWAAYSQQSSRVVQVVYHAKQRDRVLRESILPSLTEDGQDEPKRWSIFDVSCQTPADLKLQWYRLNAGDMTLMFTGPKRTSLQLRQIAPAQLALARQKMLEWLTQQQKAMKKLYRPPTDVQEIENGMKATIHRRRRFFFARWQAKSQTLVGLHDQKSDRLLILQATDEKMIEQIQPTVGWARKQEE